MAYVTPENLEEKTKSWLTKIEKVNHHKPTLRLDKSALLVVDMQNYFLDSTSPKFVSASKAILPNIIRLINAFRAKSRPVIFTRHVHRVDQSDAGIMLDWWGEVIIDGTKEAELFETVSPKPAEEVIDKCRYSAFYRTDLDSLLKKLMVEDMVICGVKTNLCCESTARDAYYRDYRLVVPADATATGHEDMHIAALLNLAYGFAAVSKSDRILKQIQ